MEETWKIFIYIPNLIGYFRICLSLYGFYISFIQYEIFLLCYITSFICDYFDGFFARLFNQCSSFGAVLDMVTDRCSTAGLLFILSHLYTKYQLLFLYLILLDFSSHWYHMYSSKNHHKVIDIKRNILLRIYYGFYPFFGYCCVGNELFYILLYVLYFIKDHFILHFVCYYICLPACILKNIINVAQLCSAANEIAKVDVKDKLNKK